MYGLSICGGCWFCRAWQDAVHRSQGSASDIWWLPDLVDNIMHIVSRLRMTLVFKGTLWCLSLIGNNRNTETNYSFRKYRVT